MKFHNLKPKLQEIYVVVNKDISNKLETFIVIESSNGIIRYTELGSGITKTISLLDFIKSRISREYLKITVQGRA